MNELQKLIEKWDEQIALHRRVCEDPLMYTKEDRLKNSHYAQAICAVVADLKKLTIPAVSNWHYLPELPEKNKEVLIAYKYDAKPIQGFWNGTKWIGSFETRDYMKDCYANDSTLGVPEYIYAWCELPDCPKVPDPF